MLLEAELLVAHTDGAADQLAEEDHRDGLPVAALAQDLGLTAVEVDLAERAGDGDRVGAARLGVVQDAGHEVVDDALLGERQRGAAAVGLVAVSYTHLT